jgi:hypothetical protein
MGTCLFTKPLLNNGSFVFAYLMVDAQQRVYMLQHIHTGYVHMYLYK